MNNKSTQNNSIKFWRNRDFRFLKFCVLFFLFPNFSFSQIYVSEGAKIYDSKNTINTAPNSETAKAEIYIAKGAEIYGLENQFAEVVYIKTEVLKKNKPLIAERKLHDSKNTKEKIVSGRKETQKQPTLVYTSSNNENSFGVSNGKNISAVTPNPSFSPKYGIAEKFDFEIPSNLSTKNEKFRTENENFSTFLISYKIGRAPPICLQRNVFLIHI